MNGTPPCGLIHPHCSNQCQKFAKVGETCATSCELQVYLAGAMYGVDIPIPPAVPQPVLAPPPGQPVAIPIPPAAKGRINVRAKGQRGEREVVKLLQAIVDAVRLRRGFPPIILQRNQLQSHLGGEDIHGLDGFAVEVKFQENENVPAWWRQAVEQAARKNAVPILFYRCTRAKWSVRFRAFVTTPKEGGDQIECDVETNFDDFTEWFAASYAETLQPSK